MRLLLIILGTGRLLWVTRGRLGGAWWAWRRETVFGTAARQPSARVRRKAMCHYLAWVWRMP